MVGRLEDALQMKRDVYHGYLKLHGEEHITSLKSASNYAWTLRDLQRFGEAKSLLCKTVPVTRRVLGEGHILTLKMRWLYAQAIYRDDGATLADLREAVTTLEDAERIGRRVLGGASPTVTGLGRSLRDARALGALRARETQPSARA